MDCHPVGHPSNQLGSNPQPVTGLVGLLPLATIGHFDIDP
jgi:hypothetical protein